MNMGIVINENHQRKIFNLLYLFQFQVSLIFHSSHFSFSLKLSLEAPAYVPKGSRNVGFSSSLHHGRQLVLKSSNVQNIFVSDEEFLDALVSSNVKLMTFFTPINTNKQLQVGSSSSTFLSK